MPLLQLKEDTNESLYTTSREAAQRDDSARQQAIEYLTLAEQQPEQLQQQEEQEVPQASILQRLISSTGLDSLPDDPAMAAAQLAGLPTGVKDLFKDMGVLPFNPMDPTRRMQAGFQALSNAVLAPFAEDSPTPGNIFKAPGRALMDTIIDPSSAPWKAEEVIAKHTDLQGAGKFVASMGLDMLADPTNFMGGAIAKQATRVAPKALPKFLALVQKIAPEDTRLLDMAVKADGGSSRAASRVMKALASEEALPNLEKWMGETIEGDFRRLSSVGGKGMAVPQNVRGDMARLTYHRREGNPDLLLDELIGGINPREPYKHSETYLKMNTPDDVENFVGAYTNETQNYIARSMERATPAQQKEISFWLTQQTDTLAIEIGDSVNRKMEPVEAFAQRRMLNDLNATIQKQFHDTEMKFWSNVDRLRFWKLISARQSMRANLSVSKNEVSALMSTLNTGGDSPATIALRADRAMNQLPDISGKAERALGKAMGDIEGNQVNVFLNGMFGDKGIVKIEKQLHFYWMNSILSSIATHTRNIGSNFAVALAKPVGELSAAPVALLRGSPGDATIHLRKAKATASSLIDTSWDLVRIMAGNEPAAAKNMEMFRNMNEAQISRPRLSKKTLAEAPVHMRVFDAFSSILPTEMLGKMDTWFKSLTYRADLNASAIETASRMTKDPVTRRQMARRLVSDPIEMQKAQAFKESERATFQNPLPEGMTDLFKSLSKFPGTKWMVPFIRTPLNITFAGIKHTPFAPVFKEVRTDLAAGGARADLAAAKMAIPSMLGLGAVAMLDDRVTGADNQRLRLNQMPEYSIMVGGKWISYKHVEPLRWVIGPMANLRDVLQSTDWEAKDGSEQASAAVAAMVGAYYKVSMDNIFLETYMKVFDGLRYGLEDGKWNAMKGFIGQVATGFVPNISQWTNRTFFDAQMRELDGFTSRVMNKIPGLSDNLPPKVGLIGEPQTTDRQLLGLIPANVEEVATHPIYGHIQATGTQVPDVSRSIQGAPLNGVQRAQLRVLRATPPGMPTLGDAAMQIFDSPRYRQAGVEGRATLLRKLITDYGVVADRILYDRDQALRDAVQLVNEQERFKRRL